MGEEKTEAKRSSKLVALGDSGDSAPSSTDGPGESILRHRSGAVCVPFSEDGPAVRGGVKAGV